MTNPVPAAVRRAAAVSALLGALAVLPVLRAAPAGAAACGPAPAGSAAVAVVVDTGTGDPVVRCVTVAERATGRAVLQAAGVPFRVGSGTSADGGKNGAFLCGILGVPQTGCVTVSSSGIAYWSYFRQPAGSRWTYSRVGFDTPVGSRCWVEGWRWTASGGVAAADNPPPRAAPPAVTCPAAPTTSSPPSTAAPANRTPSSSAAPATTVAPRSPQAPSRNAGAPVAGAAATTSTTVPGGAVSPAPGAPAARVAGETTVPGAGTAEEAGGRAEGDRSSRSERASTTAPSSDGGVPWVAVGAVLAAAGLAGAAVYRSRRRP